MPKLKNPASRTPANRTGTTAAIRSAVAGGPATVSRPTIGDAAALPPDQTRGRVAGYWIDGKGLTVKLDVNAVSRIAFSVPADAPQFRSAVSMVMVALNNRVNPATQADNPDQQWLWVELQRATEGMQVRPATKVAMSWSNDANPFDIEGFVFSMPR